MGHEKAQCEPETNRVAIPKQVVDVTDDGDYFYTGGLPVSIAPYSYEM